MYSKSTGYSKKRVLTRNYNDKYLAYSDHTNYLPLHNKKENFKDIPKKCITVLTRGYTNMNDYANLIKRNKHIEEQLIDKTIDILIFHEGNITDEQQQEIAKHTPSLRILFINVTGPYAFRKEKESIEFDPDTKGFGIGYRHMCSFWFMGVSHFIEKYNQLLRIDEDCYMNSNIDYVFSLLHDYPFISAFYSDDSEFVTKGMNQFTLEFMKRAEGEFKQHTSKKIGGPYTNLFAISLDTIRNHSLFQKYVQEVDDSNHIYIGRWGDLPLWGEAIHYIFGPETLLIDKSIRYFHESHHSQIN